MDDAKGMMITKGLALSVAYCLSYLVLRHFSFDQWFLPAGLRAVTLLLLPFRFWPFIFIGDASAVMYGRLSIADQNSATWVYVGPFLLIAGNAIAPYLLRMRLQTPQAITRQLPLVAACMSAWSGICTTVLNAMLGGPVENATIAFFTTKFFGNYLGTLMGMLPALVWITRKQHFVTLRTAFRDIFLAATSIALVFAYLKYWHDVDDIGRKSILMAMIFPALFLTYFHGWLGAAIGVLMVNIGIAQTMTYMRTPGAAPYDENVFLAQIGLSIAASALLILGGRITSHYEKAMDAGVAEEEAKRISRLALLSNESESRDQVLYMAQLHILVDEEMRSLVHWLKENGRYKEALAINSSGAQHRELFNRHAIALYPVGIEEKGLFAVVQSQAFEDRWASGTHIAIRFDDGDPRILSTELQLAAYRCFCSAIVLMCDWKPEEFRVRMRVGRTSRRRGIYFSVSVVNPGNAEVSHAGTAASLLLTARTNAHGGIVRRHAHRISVLLSEDATERTVSERPLQGE
jgi:hypothetical protein